MHTAETSFSFDVVSFRMPHAILHFSGSFSLAEQTLRARMREPPASRPRFSLV
jgi:hypothetical protein